MKKEAFHMLNISTKARRALKNRWSKMIRRCFDSRDPNFPNYGGRGITVDKEWLGPEGFETYLHEIVALPRPNGLELEAILFRRPGATVFSLDRVDTNGPYGRGRLRWADAKEQSDNQRKRVWTTVDGVRRTRADAARSAGVDHRTAGARQRKGYSALEAVALPTGGRTASARRWRDTILRAMIDAGQIFVDEAGFVFTRTADGLSLVRPALTAGGRYLGISLSVPRELHHLIPADVLTCRRKSGQYRDNFLQHRVVAIFAHGLPSEGYCEVDHRNGNKRDNRPENLRWLPPKRNRPGGEPEAQLNAAMVDYTDPDQQEAALRKAVAGRGTNVVCIPTAQEPALPDNLPDEEVARLVAIVRADPAFGASIWSDPHYEVLLHDVVAASANRMATAGNQAIIDFLPQACNAVGQKPVTHLRVSDRVYLGCVACGRQMFGTRTELRNRLRYPETMCNSCSALDRVWPDLADLVAVDPTNGFQRHPSRIASGSKCACHFRCRAAGCPNVVRRQVKTLRSRGELPVCEFHRRRGTNFAGDTSGDEGGDD